MQKIVVMIDGGHVRKLARAVDKTYDPAFIEKIGQACVAGVETVQRILYYDCAPYSGRTTLPISGEPHAFTGSDRWLRELSEKDLFAVRRGVLKFRGWVPRRVPMGPTAAALKDSDFRPDFEQKGVDMRIGLDMANYSANRSVELIALVTNDTDCIPAMKYARRAGLQVALVCVPGCSPAPELLSRSDFVRRIEWP